MVRILVLISLLAGAVTPALAQLAPKNVLIIMTDDQRFDTVGKMPKLSELAAQGVTFNNAFMPTPLCGPSRAMLFSGGYRSQNTGVLGNSAPNGGAALFKDSGNLGAMLQTAGYRTAFVGKWINGYETMGNYVPPGWTKWVGRHSFATVTSWSAFQYTIGTSTGSSTVGKISRAPDYTTDYERDEVLDFISGTPAGKPFFVLWAPSAPHPPAHPEAQDANLFDGYVYKGRGVGETDLSDKPSWVQTYTKKYSQEFVRDQLRSVQSVDRAIAELVTKLKDLGVYDNTVIIFTSDNGFLWGEHGLWAKDKAYEESLRVPMIVVMPGVAPRTDNSLVLPSLDIGPTVFEIAGIKKQTDGKSLVSLLSNSSISLRTDFFIEHTDENLGGNAIWAGVHQNRWKYVKYWTGAEELYDLNADPYELNSLHKDPSLSALKTTLQTLTDQRIGLAIVPVHSFPNGRVAAHYSYQMQPWGGVPPLNWTLGSGQMPPGLTLDPATGLIEGTPTKTGNYNFSVRVTDSSLATQTGEPKTFISRANTLTVY